MEKELNFFLRISLIMVIGGKEIRIMHHVSERIEHFTVAQNLYENSNILIPDH